MKTKIYEVSIIETLETTLTIEAKSEDEAYAKVKRMYQDEEIVLDDSDFCDYEIVVTRGEDNE